MLHGTKTATWRINDDKDIQTTDILRLLNAETDQEFGRAVVTSITEKPIGQLTTQKLADGEIKRDQEIYQDLSKFYNIQANSKTIIKVINFRLI